MSTIDLIHLSSPARPTAADTGITAATFPAPIRVSHPVPPAPTHLFSSPVLKTLPIADALLSDDDNRHRIPFSMNVSADSYRSHLLLQQRRHIEQEKEKRKRVELPSPHCDSFVHAASALSLTDIHQLTDALLCNTTLTSLSLDRCQLDSHSCPALCTLFAQHPTLTSISLSGNQLGLHADTQEARALFQTLASKPHLPNLMTLNLSNNQFTPKSIEQFSLLFLREAPSIQSVDLRENEIGLRGGWALVDAVRHRQANQETLSPLCDLLIECERKEDHSIADSVHAGTLPQPNLSQTTASHAVRPHYWPRLQASLEANRLERDKRVLREERKKDEAAKKKMSEESKSDLGASASSSHDKTYLEAATLPVSPTASIRTGIAASPHRLAPLSPTNTLRTVLLSSPNPTTAPSVTGSPSPATTIAAVVPTFINVESYHVSLARIVSELNEEKRQRLELTQSLEKSEHARRNLFDKVELLEREKLGWQKRLEDAQEMLIKERAHRKEVEETLIALREHEATIVRSHTRALDLARSQATDDRAEMQRLTQALSEERQSRADERVRHQNELRAVREYAAGEGTKYQVSHESKLRELERRLDALRVERETGVSNLYGSVLHLTPRKADLSQTSPSSSTTVPGVSISSFGFASPSASSAATSTGSTFSLSKPKPLSSTGSTSIFTSHSSGATTSSAFGSSAANYSSATAHSPSRFTLNLGSVSSPVSSPLSPDTGSPLSHSLSPSSSGFTSPVANLPPQLLVPTHQHQLLPQHIDFSVPKPTGPLKLKPREKDPKL